MIIEGEKICFQICLPFQKKILFAILLSVQFFFCDILFYVETEVKKWALYNEKKIPKIDKKKLVIGFTVVGMLEI